MADIPAFAVLQGAYAAGCDALIVIGIKPDGSMHLGMTMADAANNLWLLEMTKARLIQAGLAGHQAAMAAMDAKRKAAEEPAEQPKEFEDDVEIDEREQEREQEDLLFAEERRVDRDAPLLSPEEKAALDARLPRPAPGPSVVMQESGKPVFPT